MQEVSEHSIGARGNISEAINQSIHVVLFAVSIGLVVLCCRLFGFLDLIIRSIQLTDSEYVATAGTEMAIETTRILWGIAAIADVTLLIYRRLLEPIILNMFVCIAILALVIMSAFTQVINVLPMVP